MQPGRGRESGSCRVLSSGGDVEVGGLTSRPQVEAIERVSLQYVSSVTFYDHRGAPVAYAEDDAIYLFNGRPVGWIGADSVCAYSGRFLGWYTNGSLWDRSGRPALFTEDASGGPARPARQARPARGARQARPARGARQARTARPARSSAWSELSGERFFQS